MMEIEQNQQVEVIEDEFTSGIETWVNRKFKQAVSWIFKPPGLPSILMWPLMALIMIEVGIFLLSLPSEYWQNPENIVRFHSWQIPIQFGAIPVLLIQIAYLAILWFLIPLFNRKLGITIWLLLFSYHGYYISYRFSCHRFDHLPFITVNNCSQILFVGWILVGILFFFSMLSAIDLGIISIYKPDVEDSVTNKLAKVLRVVSVVLICGVITTLALTAYPFEGRWRLLKTADAPPARTSASLAYDNNRMRGVLFGGASAWRDETGWPSLGDTWEWDGGNWVEQHPENAPPSRREALMTYDEVRGVVVLFGGVTQRTLDEVSYFNDVWEWDGIDWVEKTPAASPPPRTSGIIYYDPVQQRIIIHGGYIHTEEGESIFLEDMWAWDGEIWEEIHLEVASNASAAAFVYNQETGCPMILDGRFITELNLNQWVEQQFMNPPQPRWAATMTYDPVQQMAVLFGGIIEKDVMNETWVYKGNEWDEINTRIQPLGRTGHNLFYDTKRKSIILFGGTVEEKVFNDTWELRIP